MKSIQLVFMLLFMSQLGAQSSLESDAFKKWYGTELERFERKTEQENRKISLRYVPLAFELMSQQEEITSKKEWKAKTKELENYLDFVLLIEDENKTITSENRNLFLMKMHENVKMTVNGKDQIACGDFAFDQIGQLGDRLLFTFSFPKPKKFETIEVLIDQGAEEPLVFTYTKKQLDNIPHVKWN